MVPCSREAAGSWGRCQAGLAKHESAARGAGRASAPPALPTPPQRAGATADGHGGCRRLARPRAPLATGIPHGEDARPLRGCAISPWGVPPPRKGMQPCWGHPGCGPQRDAHPQADRLRETEARPGSASRRRAPPRSPPPGTPKASSSGDGTSEKRSERPPLAVNKRLSDDFLLLLTFDYAE